jgi:hypothetical protein
MTMFALQRDRRDAAPDDFHDHAARRRSYEFIADAFDLRTADALAAEAAADRR